MPELPRTDDLGWKDVGYHGSDPRTEVIYNIEPFRAGVREGDWKLIWRAPLPAALELYNIAQDPSEKNNLAVENPDKVAELQKRANELAAVEAKPILLQEIFQDFRKRLAMPPALPGAEYQLDFEQ